MEALEKHLLTCQEMLLEIEQKVGLLSRRDSEPGSKLLLLDSRSNAAILPCFPQEDNGLTQSHQETSESHPQQDHDPPLPSPQNGPVRSGHEDADVLLRRLDLLKSSLVSFQRFLQERHEDHSPTQRVERPLQRKLRRSSSVQEILSSPRNKLLRQSSLQQQKELEQELEEQRGLTQALSRHSSRTSLQEPQDTPENRPHLADASPDSGLLKWDRLHAALHSLELTLQLPPSQVADTSIRSGDGAAGSVIGEQAQKELQNLVKLTRALGKSGAESGQDVSAQTVDEGAFHLLSSASLSLSALSGLFLSPVCVYTEDEGKQALLRLQGVSSELDSLSRALECEGSKFTCFLGSRRGHECLQTLVRILPVIQTGLTQREGAVKKRLEETATAQNRLKALHSAFTSNQNTVHQITHGADPPGLTHTLQVQSSLKLQSDELKSLLQNQTLPQSVLHRAVQLQEELDSALLGVSSHFVDLKSSSDLQQMFDQLLLSLRELLSAGSERVHLLQSGNISLQSKEQLQEHIKSNTKFFQFLHQHFKTLQLLSKRFLENSQQTVENLKEEVVQLQEKGLEIGTKMELTLQLWTEWEQDCDWMDSLLRNTETSFPIMPQEWDSDEHVANYLSICQDVLSVLGENSSRVSRLLKSGSELQISGCGGVASICRKMNLRWKNLTQRADHELNTVLKISKLRSRFLRDSAALCEWMGGARDMIDKRRVLSANEDEDTCARKAHFLQMMDLSKELESRAGLKAAVKTSGCQMLRIQNSDLDQNLDQDLDKDQDREKDPDVNSVWSRVRQIELQWSSVRAQLPDLLQVLHKRWFQTLTQQGALQELQSWLNAAESKLNEQSNIHQTNPDPDVLLRICKDLQTEMAAHRATVDLINQPLQKCSTTEDHGGRCERNQFSEEQGRLNHRWLSLQHRLMSQVSSVEQEQRMRTEAESCLQKLHSWIQEQNIWMDSTQRPSSVEQIQRSLTLTQELEQKIQLQSEVLEEIKKKFQNKTGTSVCEIISRVEKTSLDCDSLKLKKESLRRQLLEAKNQWDSFDEQLNLLKTKTVKISLSLELNSGPDLSPQAMKQLWHRLQLVHEELESSESDWDKLLQTEVSVKNLLHESAAALITMETTGLRHRWSTVSDSLNKMLQKSQSALSVWEEHHRLADSFSQRLKFLQTEASSVINATRADNTEEQFTMRIQHIQDLLSRVDSLQSDLQELLDASKHLTSQLDTPSSALVQSETRRLSRGVLQLNRGLKLKLETLQEEFQTLVQFSALLSELETDVQRWDRRPPAPTGGGDKEASAPSSDLDIRGRSSDVDLLNELSLGVSLSDAEANRLLRLNQSWSRACSRQQEEHSAMQTGALRGQSFEQRCESWMCFLQKMEDSLAVDVAGSYQGLRQQLCTHKRFQAELSVGHQILHSVISEALHLLHRGEVDHRDDFLLKLAALRQHWQGALQRADQRRALIEGLVRHWHLYHRTTRKLRHFLSQTRTLLPPAGLSHCSLQELRRSLHLLQHLEVKFEQYQSSFLHTLEVGRQLFSMGDQDTQAQLQVELGTLQHEWDNLHALLGKRMDLTGDIIKNWERCETGLANSALRVKDVKTRLNQSLPECDEDNLQREQRCVKEAEDLMEDWAGCLSDLKTMKTDLSQFIMAEDELLLQEQVEFLHLQWDELCVKVSHRKQEIADRLNAWIIFKEKNRELCEWLTQMENKVAHSSDLNIEEMVEKLKKDCMEEINLFSENKTHLKKLGEQLISASNKTKEAEVNEKLKDVNDRWQHLFDHIQARVCKLKETLVTVQQLDKNMSNLKTWLSRIETELSKPVVYNVCHSEEIQRRLKEQQDLQRDIDQHTDSVASVLTLCDVLLHDSDACSSDAESDSFQQTTSSLDQRWRNICAMSMERRMRIEETSRLWCKFLDDYSRFEDWLKSAELTAANPESENVLYTCAKEELKKFEAFQRQVHERLTQLELVNKQYRRLAREQRTDAACRLKLMVQEGNQRWDRLQKRVYAIIRRLKHFTSQREEFEGTREGILVWLTEMDLQLTNVEHFSESDVQDKMRQLNVFQQEIMLNTNAIDALIVFGETLIQKSSPEDAALMEEELEEMHSYCQEVFGRVARFHHRLVHRRPILDDFSDSDLDSAPDLSRGLSWTETKRKRRRKRAEGAGSHLEGAEPQCHLLAPPLERSGRETPVSVDSIPLEWDHTVDVGGSSSHEDDDDATFFSALSVKSINERPSWLQDESLKRQMLQCLNPSHCDSAPYQQQHGYVKLMSECSGNIDRVNQVKLILNDEEELSDSGLTHSSTDGHYNTGVIERWELLQAQSHRADVSPDPQQWHKLTSDLCDVTSWLGRALPELDQLQQLCPCSSLKDLQDNICKLKETQRLFCSYKCLMISVNLGVRQLLHASSSDPQNLQEIQEAVDSANHSWTQACSSLQGWELRLHQGLCKCQELHESLHSLLLWLSQCEGRLYSVNLRDQSVSRELLLRHRDTLQSLQEDLRSREGQVSSLQTLSCELLVDLSSEEGLEAREKVHVIHNKLTLLLRQVQNDTNTLNARLERSSLLDSDSTEPLSHSTPVSTHKEGPRLRAAEEQPATRRAQHRDASSPHRPFLRRVLRAAFPLHLLLLLVLVLACLVPLSEDQYNNCALSNNFARSFYPMLRYTNGPPPT
ncbi:nesprin-2-like isoform X2 [Periophthalmus magnuspinnatus]|uniref:nesprin-2-like isoform X2 n=1 Tax=Periophthalmus magnuspinnatus TaxID=409849 RepID=UPI002436D748|nr:nesprin-2-like isoform X2 [Periophthalmus magnuspinnatus]